MELMHVQTKPRMATAIQWDGSREGLKELYNWLFEIKKEHDQKRKLPPGRADVVFEYRLARATDEHFPRAIFCLEGTFEGSIWPGWWIVVPDREWPKAIAMSREDFKNEYVLLATLQPPERS